MEREEAIKIVKSHLKAFTDIEQSKKLAEILPLESADMRYAPFGDIHPWVWDGEVKLLEKGSIPCWSLAALLQIIPKDIEGLNRLRIDIDNVDFSIWYDDLKGYGVNDKLPDITLKEPIDACYEMVLKLHESKLL